MQECTPFNFQRQTDLVVCLFVVHCLLTCLFSVFVLHRLSLEVDRKPNNHQTRQLQNTASETYMENAHTTINGKCSGQIFIKLCKTRTCNVEVSNTFR